MNNEILLVIYRTGIILIILFISTKCMGKKQVSQMNMFDYLIGITIGSIASDIALDIEKNIVSGILSLEIFSLAEILVTFLTLKNMILRRILVGVPSILIEKGKIIENSLKKEGIDINDLQEEARQKGYFDLSEINYAILETNGKISFLAKDEYSKVNKKDMNIKKENKGLNANIIIDGDLLINNLEAINKDKSWLDKELLKKGYYDYNSILLLTIDESNNIVIYDKNDKESIKIFE